MEINKRKQLKNGADEAVDGYFSSEALQYYLTFETMSCIIWIK